jgi:hypothetical protein
MNMALQKYYKFHIMRAIHAQKKNLLTYKFAENEQISNKRE